jgi:tetratricopeptide (TPR) repeat protein
VYLELGDTARARKQLQRAVALEPNMSSAYFNLFKLESAEHNLPAAADALRGCLRCDPFDAVALTCLATLSMEHVSANASAAAVPPDPVVFEPAVALAERAVTITQGRDPRCLEAYARTLNAAGHRAQAALQAQRATRAARDLQQGDLAAECAAYATSLAP